MENKKMCAELEKEMEKIVGDLDEIINDFEALDDELDEIIEDLEEITDELDDYEVPDWETSDSDSEEDE